MYTLPSDIQDFIDAELADQVYASRDELIAEAVRQLRLRKEQIERLRRDIDQARSELDRGEGIEILDDDGLQSFFDDIRARGQTRLESLGRTS